jgi:hypothetical protein
MENSTIQKCCCCETNTPQPKKKTKLQSTFSIVRTALLSLVIAFFPKCPMCWAVYMSMFGSLGLSQVPYMGWLLPVLIGFLGFHLFMLYRKGKKIGYIPFGISLMGAFFIMAGRLFPVLPENKVLLILGMVCLISSSLISSFSSFQIQLLKQKTV